MHILFTMAGWTDQGGGTMLPRQICRALARKGHRVTVLYTAGGAESQQGACPPIHLTPHQEEGVHLIGIHGAPGFSYSLEHPEVDVDNRFMRRIVSGLLAEIRPDLVHYHSLAGFSLAAVDEVVRAGIPSLFTSHNYWPLCPRIYLFRKEMLCCRGPSDDGSRCSECVGHLGKQADYAWRVQRTRLALNRLVERHMAVSRRARDVFVRNGYDPARLEVLPAQSETVDWIWESLGSQRKTIDRTPLPLRVGFFGNLLAWKGVHVLMEALQFFRHGDLECHVFGGGPEPYTRRLFLADGKRLARFHGPYGAHQLPRRLTSLDLVVVPSICEETGGLVVLEALAGRVPVVASRIGGLPELVEDGVNGFLFSPGQSKELAEILNRFLTQSTLLGQLQDRILPPKGFNPYLNDLTTLYARITDDYHASHSIRR